MKLYKVCIDHRDFDRSTTSSDRKFFSDLDILADFLMSFQHADDWELRIFPVDAKLKYPWSKDYEEE